MHDRVKFQFDTSFDTANGGRSERPKPTFTEADIAAARDQGFAAGHSAGAAEAWAKIEGQAAVASAEIAKRIGELGQKQAAAIERSARDAVALAVQVANKLAPAALQRFAATEVEAVLSHCLSDMQTEPRMVLRASEAIVEALRERVNEIAARSGFPGLVVLLPDDTLTGANCRLEWADGGLERDSAATMRKIEQAVGRFLDGGSSALPAGAAPERSL